MLLTFLYTRCPDVCPLLAANLNAVLRSLSPKERSGVRVIAISVDPAHDTPRAVGAFARTHALVPQFRYVIGSNSELQPVWQGYNVVVQPRNAEETEHSAYVLLIDRAGKPRMTIRRRSAPRPCCETCGGSRSPDARRSSTGASVALGHRRTLHRSTCVVRTIRRRSAARRAGCSGLRSRQACRSEPTDSGSSGCR